MRDDGLVDVDLFTATVAGFSAGDTSTIKKISAHGINARRWL
jgi:hypothetical protein